MGRSGCCGVLYNLDKTNCVYALNNPLMGVRNFFYSYLAHGSCQQYLTCSFMPACLRCRTLVDTKVLLYVLCCSVQGRLKAALLCLRYVDTMAFGACFVLLGVEKKKSRFKNKSFVACFCSLEAILLAELIQLALSPRRAPPQQSCSPRGWYSPAP